MDKTEEEKGQEASEGDQAGVLLSELEFIVSRNHAVVPSIIQCCGIATCLLLCGVEVATSFIMIK